MTRKHVVITGGASGLGLGCAAGFRRLGYDLTLVDVDVAATQRAIATLARIPAAGELRAQALDLADRSSIATAALALREQGRPVDVLVNNAGIYPPARRCLNGEGQELSFAIAHLGHFRLTHALWPLLEAAPAARVISISSLVQRQASINFDDLAWQQRYEPIRAYQQTKLACLMFARELQRRLGAVGHRVSSYAAHPGVCRTQIGRNRPRSAQDSPWQRFATAALALGLRYVGQSPEAGARPVIAAATTDEFPAGTFVGPRWLNESFGEPVRITPGAAASEPALATRLWVCTEQLTGLRWTL
jgi:NAD(P)-dependent dehydrogenase (short-subunit alcohol dehydrogenase family)